MYNKTKHKQVNALAHSILVRFPALTTLEHVQCLHL